MSDKKITDNALDILANAQPRKLGERVAAGAVKNVSKANYYQTRINRVNASLLAFVGFVYEQHNGHFINIEAGTGRLQITAPWTRSGYRDYGLRKAEGLALQKIMKDISRLDNPVWWVMFDDDIRRWCVNLADYRNPLQAQSYIESVGIQGRFVGAWKQVANSRYSGPMISTHNQHP